MNQSDTKSVNVPFSIFNKKEKWFIVGLVAFAGLFSPLTANIYFPAIPAISKAFNKSTELINLTVTMYMILQGIAPMVWGPFSDSLGRRPAEACCLLILSLSCVGLALVPTSDYWLLMVLRCLQSAGSASTIAIGAGVIGDISTPDERGGFFGIFTLGPMIGPAIGPVIGGVLTDRLGWRSIFWFLCIACSTCFVILVLIMPETLRARVGNGSVTPSALYRPIIPIIGRNRPRTADKPPPQKPFQNPLRLFAQPDIIILLAITAISCAVFYGVLASVSTLFNRTYPYLNETKLGLVFLAMGGGMVIGTVINGRMLDREYQLTKRKATEKMDANMEGRPEDVTKDENFPIEYARLRLLPALVLLSSACCVGYGWCLEKRVNIAAPLVLQILLGYTAIALMNSTSTLMIDLSPGQGSSVTGCSNLVRCLLSAIVVSVIELIMEGIGVGWTYVLLAGIGLFSIPLVYLEIKKGPSYRARRRKRIAASDAKARDEKREEERKEKESEKKEEDTKGEKESEEVKENRVSRG